MKIKYNYYLSSLFLLFEANDSIAGLLTAQSF
jgi:hypothetical protein